MDGGAGAEGGGSGASPGGRGSDLGRRVAVAAVGIPVGILVIRVGGWLLGVVIAAIAVVCALEFFALARAGGARPMARIGGAAAGALVLLAVLFPDWGLFASWALPLVVALALGALALSVWRRWPGGRPLSSVSATTMGALYAGGTLSFAPLLRALPEAGGGTDDAWAGALLLIFPLTMTWVGDSAAYFGGRAWGRRKLIPRVSPGKTVEGGISGLVAASLSGGLYAALLLADRPPIPVSFLEGAAIGLLVGAAAQVGDLVESVLKREAGVKDSGTILPGHGGLLDRFDAVLLTLPLTYAVLAAREALFR